MKRSSFLVRLVSGANAIWNGGLRVCALWVTAWVLAARLAPAPPLPRPVRHMFENGGAVAQRALGDQRTRSPHWNSAGSTGRGLAALASTPAPVSLAVSGLRVPFVFDRIRVAAPAECRCSRAPPLNTAIRGLMA